MQKPYSYHTFLFPFIWNKDKRNKTINSFIKRLLDNDIGKWQRAEDIPDNETMNKERYQQYQYYKNDVINVLFNKKVPGIQHYVYYAKKLGRSQNIGKYIITKGNDKYELNINHIKLSVYNTGVAIMSLELEYDGKGIDQPEERLNAINTINEYGRRIAFPFIAEPKDCLIADRIEIVIGDSEPYTENFKENLENFLALRDKLLLQKYIMQPLKMLLFTTSKSEADKGKHLYYIEPICDDRMFVCCLVADDEISEKLGSTKEDDLYSDEEMYKFAFVEKSCTCPTVEMRRRIMERCSYTRWLSCGTIDFVTHHSFMRITSPGAYAPVILPFLLIYVKMAELAVLQRATIIALENECFITDTKHVSKLQECFVKAQQSVLLDECTVQEQGMEIFQMLRNELFIHNRIESLNKRLNDLYENANLKQDKVSNGLGVWLGIVGTIFAAIEIGPELLKFVMWFATTLWSGLLKLIEFLIAIIK